MHQFSVTVSVNRTRRVTGRHVLHTSLRKRDGFGVDLVDLLGVGNRDKGGGGGKSQGRESREHRDGNGRVGRKYRGWGRIRWMRYD